jgi:hypothetical protein
MADQRCEIALPPEGCPLATQKASDGTENDAGPRAPVFRFARPRLTTGVAEAYAAPSFALGGGQGEAFSTNLRRRHRPAARLALGKGRP